MLHPQPPVTASFSPRSCPRLSNPAGSVISHPGISGNGHSSPPCAVSPRFLGSTVTRLGLGGLKLWSNSAHCREHAPASLQVKIEPRPATPRKTAELALEAQRQLW